MASRIDLTRSIPWDHQDHFTKAGLRAPLPPRLRQGTVPHRHQVPTIQQVQCLTSLTPGRPEEEAPPVTASQAGLKKHLSPLRHHKHPAPGPTAHSGHQGAPGGLLGPQTPEPDSKGPQGDGPSRCLGSAPRHGHALTAGSSLTPAANAAQSGSDRHRHVWDTRGEPHTTGKAYRPPPGWPQVASSGRGGGAQKGTS
ncbi:hypothetical protein NDU88_002070 [Pleurodeles waltl]|uniref:Uncharacterized protein n=1 Tax=Pleurodeles waltl TaxID=8319 RepID=A0AAV7NFA0_PLEWA|nr:hypothetical protein NDU88_002070 [Pleurodeles waltl]